MKFYDLIVQMNWAEAKAALLWGYPEETGNLPRYEAVFRKISTMPPEPSDMRICLQESEGRVHVGGRDGSLKKDHGTPETAEGAFDEETFALEFAAWAEWLDMEIDETALASYSSAEIVAHCLCEMTFISFDEQKIEEELEEMRRRVAEIDDMTEEERKENLIPAEEVFGDLKRRLKDPGRRKPWNGKDQEP